MPPDKAKLHPSADVRREAVGWFQALRDYETQHNAGDPGRVLARRLSNVEYDYTIRDLTGDPWNGRTLEWATASPPAAWNFAVQPKVAGLDAFWNSKSRAQVTKDEPTSNYEPVEMPMSSE